jgi:hypothetical protein
MVPLYQWSQVDVPGRGVDLTPIHVNHHPLCREIDGAMSQLIFAADKVGGHAQDAGGAGNDPACIMFLGSLHL